MVIFAPAAAMGLNFMERSVRITEAVEEFRRLRDAQSEPDLEVFLAKHAFLLPELQPALEALLEEPAARFHDATADFTSSHHDAREGARRLKYVGEFRLDQLLGVGAFGEVWQATQTTLSRTVAVKILRGCAHHADALPRFQREAKTLAQLSHPNIVSVLELGEHEGTHYIAMEYVEGRDLKNLLEDGLPTLRWAADALRTIALAVEHAHTANLIHRDIKPANILVGSHGELKVTDFGLARHLTDTANLTSDGDILGTISYMAPEQAIGRNSEVGTAVDVYALGATFYHVLTGRPPFPLQARTPTLATLEEIQQREPMPPRQLRPDRNIPQDLEIICLKCLQKEPARRYLSAGALAADLGRFLDGEPILARPSGWTYRIGRKIRKRPALVGLSAAVIVVSIIGALVAASLAVHGTKLATTVEQTKRQVSLVASERDTERLNREQAELAKATAEGEREEARQAERWKEYTADLQRMQVAWDDGKLSLVRELLAKHQPGPGKKDLRGIEWHYWRHRLVTESQILAGVRGRSVALSDDGRYLACSDDSHVVLWDCHSQQQLHRWPISRGPPSRVVDLWDAQAPCDASVAFSPDGKLLAATAFHISHNKRVGFLRVWNLATGEERLTVLGDPQLSGRAVIFSPDSQQVIAGGYAHFAKAWNLATREAETVKPVFVPGPSSGVGPLPEQAPAGTPTSGKSVVRELCFWQHLLVSRTGERGFMCLPWNGGKPNPPFVRDTITAQMQHSQLGNRQVVYGRDNRGEVFAAAQGDDDLATLYISGNPIVKGTEAIRLDGGPVRTLAVSGSRLAAAGRDDVVRVWQVNLQQAPREFRGAEAIQQLAFGHDDKVILALAKDGVHLWRLDGETALTLPVPRLKPAEEGRSAMLSPGLQYRARLEGGSLKVCRRETNEELFSVPAKPLVGLWFGPDEHYVVVASGDIREGGSALWSLNDKREVARLPLFATIISADACAFSADGERVAGGGRVWDTQTGRLLLKADVATKFPSVALSSNGRLVAFGSPRGFFVWNVETKQQVMQGPIAASSFAFHPKKDVLLVVGKELSAWDLTSSQQLPTTFAGAKIASAAFSSDGERLYLLPLATVHQGRREVLVYSVRGWNMLASIVCNAPSHASNLEPLFVRLLQTQVNK